MTNISPMALIMFASSVLFQVIGVLILPLTKGYTAPVPAVLCAGSFMIGTFLLARFLYSGVNLSLAIPLVTTAIPLCSVVAGIYLYGEAASPGKVVALLAACLMIGVASVL